MIKKFFSLFSKCISCWFKDKAIKRLENQINNLRCDNDKHHTQYVEQKRKSDDLEKLLDSRDLQLSNLRCDNDKHHTQYVEQKHKLDDLEKLLDSRNLQLHYRNKYFQQAQQELDDLKKLLGSKEQELDKLKREVNKHNKSPKKAIRKRFSKTKIRNTDDSSKTNFTTCTVCDGDGGIRGGCFRCEGRGYLKL